jgi:hypothetical protein
LALEVGHVALERLERALREREGRGRRRTGRVDGDDRDVLLGLEDEAIRLLLVDEIPGARFGRLLLVVLDARALAERPACGDEQRRDAGLLRDLVDGVAARQVLRVYTRARAEGGDLVRAGAGDQRRRVGVDEDLARRRADGERALLQRRDLVRRRHGGERRHRDHHRREELAAPNRAEQS